MSASTIYMLAVDACIVYALGYALLRDFIRSEPTETWTILIQLVAERNV